MYYDSVTDKSYIAGNFFKVNDTQANVITFDGTGFDLMPNAPALYINDIVRYRDKIYMGSDNGLSIWDGTAWTEDSSNNTGRVRTLRVINDKLYVTGSFSEVVGRPFAGVAVLDDTTWSAFPGLDTVRQGAAIMDIAYYKGEFYLASKFQNAARPERTGLIRFNGQKWYNVADFCTDGLGFVKELLVWKDTLYVGGYFDEATGCKGNGIAKWDGQQWHRLQQGLQVHYERGAVTEMAVHNDKLYVSGTFTTVNGWLRAMFNGRFACWDGSQWCDMGTAFGPHENVFGFWQNRFFVAGGFEQVAGMPTSSLAEWIGGNYADTCINNPVSIKDKKLQQVQLSIYPNPVQSSTSLQINSSKQLKISIGIYDNSGRLLRSILQTLHKGQNSVKLDCGELAAGQYNITISGDGVYTHHKMTKL